MRVSAVLLQQDIINKTFIPFNLFLILSTVTLINIIYLVIINFLTSPSNSHIEMSWNLFGSSESRTCTPISSATCCATLSGTLFPSVLSTSAVLVSSLLEPILCSGSCGLHYISCKILSPAKYTLLLLCRSEVRWYPTLAIPQKISYTRKLQCEHLSPKWHHTYRA